MQVQICALLAIILVAQHCEAGTISFGDLMGDISKVAVAGEKLRHQLENEVGAVQQEPSSMASSNEQLFQDMSNALDKVAVSIIYLSSSLYNVQPESYNIIGDAMGSMGTALGDLANMITNLSVQLKPQDRSISTSGASIIGELGSISAKNIAAAANAAAPYVKKLNVALGDLANTITNLSVN